MPHPCNPHQLDKVTEVEASARLAGALPAAGGPEAQRGLSALDSKNVRYLGLWNPETSSASAHEVRAALSRGSSVRCYSRRLSWDRPVTLRGRSVPIDRVVQLERLAATTHIGGVPGCVAGRAFLYTSLPWRRRRIRTGVSSNHRYAAS